MMSCGIFILLFFVDAHTFCLLNSIARQRRPAGAISENTCNYKNMIMFWCCNQKIQTHEWYKSSPKSLASHGDDAQTASVGGDRSLRIGGNRLSWATSLWCLWTIFLWLGPRWKPPFVRKLKWILLLLLLFLVLCYPAVARLRYLIRCDILVNSERNRIQHEDETHTGRHTPKVKLV